MVVFYFIYMFIDKVVIELKSGKGGDGMIAFIHEKYRPFGGPSGGNGGKGGSIFLRASQSVTTLVNYRHGKLFRADDGEKGDIKNKYGKNAKDIYLDVPLGTVVFLEKDHKFVVDLKEDGQTYLICKGGRGGRGNACFKSSRNKAPKIAENGLPGENKRIILELKLLADVSLVGLPNAGKSTFLSVISNAKCEIGDYPFTTLVPNLGVTYLDDGSSFVVADMPGLIEGASKGKGLGFTFLRHIERTRVILHLVDINQENPYENYLKIRKELDEYKINLKNKKELIVATKVDEEGSLEKLEEFKKQVKQEVYPVSSLTNEGIKEVLYKAKDILKEVTTYEIYNEEDIEVTYDLNKKEEDVFNIRKEKDNVYVIYGERVERTFDLINISTDEGMMRLLNYLTKIGVDEKLQEIGAKDGDIVKLKDFEFEYFE